ncbi:MAG: hypothetical protein PVH87_24525, partial [Desulfobacteraceae bacterium]
IERRTIIHEQKRSIFLGNNQALLSEYGYNINMLTLIVRLILKSKKRAKCSVFRSISVIRAKMLDIPVGNGMAFYCYFPIY